MRKRRHLFPSFSGRSLANVVKIHSKASNVQKRRRLKNVSSCPNHAIPADSALDLDHFLAMNNQRPSDIAFGVYSLDDWVTNSHVRKFVEQGINSIVMDGTWISPSNWKLQEWVVQVAERFNFMSTDRAILFFSWGIVEATTTRGKIAVELNGEAESVFGFIKKLDSSFKRAENLIEWVYSSRGDSISVPLNYRPALKGAYPWLPKDIESYIDEYMNSDASVLILLGPPGTGKTTFIKNLIHRSGADAKVTYDEKVMGDDSLFAGFIEGSEKFLIMEDADAFLASREDGNTMMHRFLNVSDGLISAKDKKLVFSTNLPSIRDIDSALMRPGRCFDVVEFRPLTRAEAIVIADDLDLTLPEGSDFTLAELFNQQPSSDVVQTRKVGFI